MEKSGMEIVTDYFSGLGYTQSGQKEDRSVFVHEKTEQEVHIQWGLINDSLPTGEWDERVKYLLILDEYELEALTIPVIERYSDSLPSHVEITVYQDDSIEHLMKDIWFFLNK